MGDYFCIIAEVSVGFYIDPNLCDKEGEDVLVRLTSGDLWANDAIDLNVHQSLNWHNINAKTDLKILVLFASNFKRIIGDSGDKSCLLINNKKAENGEHSERSVAIKLRGMMMKSQKYMLRSKWMRL